MAHLALLKLNKVIFKVKLRFKKIFVQLHEVCIPLPHGNLDPVVLIDLKGFQKSFSHIFFVMYGSNKKGTDHTVWMRRLICAFVVRIWQNRFSHDMAHMISTLP